MSKCPACSSENVYSLLNTLHCKRCRHIWKEGDDGENRSPARDTSLRIKKPADPLETRMEKKLNEYLARYGGKICITTITWPAGDISFELFRSYLRQCVKNRTLAETKDHYGRIWYSRPE